MADFTELEYKYKADDVSFARFKKLMDTLPVKSFVEASSWDYYYRNEDHAGFMRYRASSVKPELTRKIKTTGSNNFNRFEVDIPLDKKADYNTINTFLEKLGYSENFRIFKNCFVYFLDNVNYVYYIVYDENMKEQGRFVEVEVNKSKVQELNDKHRSLDGAVKELNKQEALLKEIGISPQNRMKKSLFELFERY